MWRQADSESCRDWAELDQSGSPQRRGAVGQRNRGDRSTSRPDAGLRKLVSIVTPGRQADRPVAAEQIVEVARGSGVFATAPIGQCSMRAPPAGSGGGGPGGTVPEAGRRNSHDLAVTPGALL